MVAWYEENAAIVAAVLNLDAMTIHGYVTLPKYVVDNPAAVKLDKSTHLQELDEEFLHAVGIDDLSRYAYDAANDGHLQADLFV